MRFWFAFFFIAMTSASALAQQDSKFDLSVGIGTDLTRYTPIFKDDGNLSASICYNVTDLWGLTIYLSRQDYSFDRLTSDDQFFPDHKKPDIDRTVTSLLVGARCFLVSRSKLLNPYISAAMGFSNNAASPQTYEVVTFSQDTVQYGIKTGNFLLGLLSLGIEVRPLSFANLFAELQIAAASDTDRSPGSLAVRIGIGITL